MPTKFYYTCAVCEEECFSTRPDTDARNELAKDFPDIPTSECAIVCDDCYKLVMGTADAH